ncbi:sensor histidine kinase [Aureivirga marina]|uniref:sensor histidine kinase n=1 Tax=Aureivirga marina TaxID=1182451 RepID=UPI0018CA66FF|nr:sensor histidine kinase [Aureivirga marina]
MITNEALEEHLLTIIIGSIIFILLLSTLVVVFFFLSRKKILKEQLDKERIKVEHKTKILHETIITQEKERKRIAKDLHDDVSSSLNAVKLMLQTYNTDTTGNSKDNIVSAINTLNQTIDSSRKIAHGLLPPVLEKFGLKTALEQMQDDYNRSDQVEITQFIQYENKQLNATYELNIYRIFQELVNNSVRHGKANDILIKIITNDDDSIKMSYRDDGNGFDLEKVQKAKGLGMSNIDSRVELIKGEIEYKTAPGEGFQAFITV